MSIQDNSLITVFCYKIQIRYRYVRHRRHFHVHLKTSYLWMTFFVTTNTQTDQTAHSRDTTAFQLIG